MASPPIIEVIDWGFYEDGTETGSTLIGSINVNPTTLETDTIYLLRFGIVETAGNSARNTITHLEFNKDAAGLVPVGAATDCQHIDSTNLTNEANTTKRLGGAWILDTTNAGVADLDNIAGSGITDLAATGYEALYAIQFNAAGTYVLHVVDDAGDPFDVYQQTDPTVVVTAGSVPETVTLVKATMAVFTGQFLPLHDTVVPATATFAAWVAQPIQEATTILEELTVATWAPYIGQTIALAETIVLVKATMQSWIGQAITFSGGVVETITTAAWAIFAGRPVDPIQAENLILTKATMKQFLGQPLLVIQAVFITLTAASTQLVGRSITVTAVGIRAVYNIVKPLVKTVIRRMAHDPNDKNKDYDE